MSGTRQLSPSLGSAVPAAASGALGPRPMVLAQGVAGVLMCGALVVAGPLTPWPSELFWGGVAGAILVVCWGLAMDRKTRRQDLLALLADALAGVVGPRSEGVRLTAGGWSGGWIGNPGRLKLRYSGSVSSNDPLWVTSVLEICDRRIAGAKYKVLKHQPRRTLLVLQRVSKKEDDDQPSVLEKRATEYLKQMMGPTAKVTKVQWSQDDDSRLLALEVKHSAGTKLAATGYQRRIERVINDTLPGRWRAIWNMEDDHVRFEVRPTFPAMVWAPTDPVDTSKDVLANYRRVRIPYGVDEDGNEMKWCPAQDPNFMLVGAPGTGKTVTAHGLLTQVARRGWLVWVLDGKAIEFLGFRDWPNVQIVATRVEEQVALLHRAHAVMEHRYELIVQGQATEDDFEPLLVVIDEWADFRGNVLEWYLGVKLKGGSSQPPCLDLVGSIARKGRSARVHLEFGTQRPDAKYFGGDMRDNFRMRVSQGRLSPQGAMMMWENPAVGVHVPKGCPGRATTVNEANRPVEFQTYYTPDPRKAHEPQELDVLQQLKPAETRWPRLVIVPPVAQQDLDSEDGLVIPLSYFDYADATWVLASDRPDLAPSSSDTKPDRTVDSSPMAMLGLRNPGSTSDPSLRPHSEQATKSSASNTSAAGPAERLAAPHEVPVDAEGYGEVEAVDAAEVQPGWLVQVDPDSDHWAVIEASPEPDPFDEDLLCVPWRDDYDDAGTLTVEDELIVRRPLEEAGEQR